MKRYPFCGGASNDGKCEMDFGRGVSKAVVVILVNPNNEMFMPCSIKVNLVVFKDIRISNKTKK